MQDPRLRHRRSVLGWTLIALAVLPLLPVLAVLPFLGLAHDFIVGVTVHSWAALTGLILIALALASSGAYLLRTEGRR